MLRKSKCFLQINPHPNSPNRKHFPHVPMKLSGKSKSSHLLFRFTPGLLMLHLVVVSRLWQQFITQDAHFDISIDPISLQKAIIFAFNFASCSVKCVCLFFCQETYFSNMLLFILHYTTLSSHLNGTERL